eukprot:715350-Pyramimonas_sp.AAC.1
MLPAVVAARAEAAVSPLFIGAGLDSDDPIFAQGMFLYDEEEIPPPSYSGKVVLDGPGGEELAVEVEGVASLVQGHRLDVAPDGSCTRPGLKELERASWSIAVFAPSNVPVAVIRGPVAGHLPQSSSIAESVALCLIDQIADREALAGSGCTSAIRRFQQPVQAQLRASNQAAGIL